jgi:hypothetical protein
VLKAITYEGCKVESKGGAGVEAITTAEGIKRQQARTTNRSPSSGKARSWKAFAVPLGEVIEDGSQTNYWAQRLKHTQQGDENSHYLKFSLFAASG